VVEEPSAFFLAGVEEEREVKGMRHMTLFNQGNPITQVLEEVE